MKGKKQDIDSILKKGETKARCILLYGPNTFVIRELYKQLCKSLFDENDVFTASEFSIKDIIKDSNNFFTEIGSLPLNGNRKYIRVNMENSESGEPVKKFLEEDFPETTLLIKAENLSPRSSIRKTLEKSKDTLIVPFYEDDTFSIKNFIKTKVKERNFIIDDLGINALISICGLERSNLSDALERVMLFYEFSGNKKLNENNIKEILFDTNQSQLSELCTNVCLGNTSLAKKNLTRLFLQGVTPPQFISTLILHFQKLHIVGLSLISGLSLNDALKNIKPPIFFKEINTFKTQTERWNVYKIERALEILTESDFLSKTTPGMGKSIIGNVVIRLANVAKK